MPAPKRPVKKVKVAKPPFLIRLLPEAAQAFTARRIMDIFALFFALSGLYVIGALLSYHPGDPSMSVAGMNDRPDNMMGAYGARTADLLIQTFGMAGILPGAALCIWAACLFRRRKIKPVSLRLTAVIISMFAAATAISRLPAPESWPNVWAGGAIGTLLSDRLNHFMAFHLIWPLAALVFAASFAFAASMGRPEVDWLVEKTREQAVLLWQRLCEASLNFVHWVRHHNTELPQKPRKERVTVQKGVRIQPKLDQDVEVEYDADEEEEEAYVSTRSNIEVIAPSVSKSRPSSGQSKLKLGQYDEWDLPSIDLLQDVPVQDSAALFDKDALRKNAELLMQVLTDFNVQGDITAIHPGPVVTLYELEPAPGTKTARVIALADDIARSMAAVSVRCAVVPGRNVIGIELPNKRRQTVFMRELLETKDVETTTAKLPLILGKDISGKPIIGDLTKMPHLLVAGTTGSGKSVAVNTMILSLLYRLPPEKCRFIMIDPKMLELSVYDDIPHLLSPVVTEPGKAVVSLKWTVAEMEERYRAMSKLGVRNIEGYNQRLKEARDKGEILMRKVQTGFDPETGKPTYEEQPLDLTELPYIVVIVDEFADLMLVAGKDVENAIQRLAQMARAAGIHLIMATQRPSVDVITGVIKANFPTRISFAVTSKIDSRTILGEGGAEQLLGMGDMLYMAGGGRIYRVHSPFVSDEDVENVVNMLKGQAEPNYVEDITTGGDYTNEVMGALFGTEGSGDDVDELYDEAVAIISREGKASTSFIQRHLQIGYNRAARIIEEMERQGVVTQANRVGKRDVLVGDHSGYRDVG